MKTIPARFTRATQADKFLFYQQGDCITLSKEHLPDNCIDLIITDPPYGINGDTLHKHYNRNENFVIDGYTEIHENDYFEFSRQWIKEAERVLRPGGSLYIVSGWSHLRHILNALDETTLTLVNHIIWKYNFGVYTQRKFTTSHYHILYLTKPGGKITFNTHARYSPKEKTEANRSVLFADMEDVWIINREYKTGKVRHKNELPVQLLAKMIQYSSNEGDILCDLFAGSFSLAKVAKGLNRNSISFEISPEACSHQVAEVERVPWGSLLTGQTLPFGKDERPKNQRKAWTQDEMQSLQEVYLRCRKDGLTKIDAIHQLESRFERGYFAILNALKKKNL